VNGTYTGIGGAGGAYEDEKAAFALSPCIGKFRGLGRPLRGRICSLVAAKRTSVELMALKSNISNPIARMSMPRDGLYAVLRRIMYVFRLLSFSVQLWSDVSKVKLRLMVEEHSIIGCSSRSSSPISDLNSFPYLLQS